MPSSNKTSHLALNWWLGGDKPKKDDFNADNQLVDAAFGKLEDRLEELESGAGGELAQQLQEHEEDNDRHLSSGDREELEALAAHAADGEIHVTAEEKAAWGGGGGGDGAAPVIGTYAGNGFPNQTVSLGFTPKYGFLFAAGRGAYETDWVGQESMIFSGFFSDKGTSFRITVVDGGLKVENTSRPPNGCSYKYNETGVTYVYVAWK